ncbi:aminotransferase class IV family protein [Celeribacter indicus]|uniref:Probable branched-chain-amino-acid aminotransferase n=1 Tax=Celeribacter indicus TaxID=1208324 RepID=A0A0B5DR04_9RHOB|nr:aminotransferase class IV family protein [Celeribacter indicus]AJE45958.1 hypothetical protein P73_1243 [Celeribacter indicus]SDW64749.1 4-amino-4-deoxychorismate lyase [Celeribacter indicus]
MADGFRIIETLGYAPAGGAERAARHVARMGRTAAALGIAFDAGRAAALLDGFSHEAPRRLRLTLARDGALELEDGPLAPAKPLWRVALHEARLSSADPWLRVKTTERSLYDEARANLPEGIDEWLFLNERGELCEGTITNVFLEIEGQWLTPALSSGLLPGILRETLIGTGDVTEGVLTAADLHAARRIRVGNALRGLIGAELVA